MPPQHLFRVRRQQPPPRPESIRLRPDGRVSAQPPPHPILTRTNSRVVIYQVRQDQITRDIGFDSRPSLAPQAVQGRPLQGQSRTAAWARVSPGKGARRCTRRGCERPFG